MDQVVIFITMKVCVNCKLEKEYSQFTLNKVAKDGHHYICKQCRKQYHLDNREKVRKYTNEYNKKYILPVDVYSRQKEKIKQWNTNKVNTDPLYKLRRTLYRANHRGLIHKKSKHSLEIVGLESWELLKAHIESQFIKGMNWDNWGRGDNKWVIDHRIPLASANTEDEIYRLNHHTNLQPMWWRENLEKGAK
jgi:hypothetical protein